MHVCITKTLIIYYGSNLILYYRKETSTDNKLDISEENISDVYPYKTQLPGHCYPS